jgi:hypothetical protein
VVELLGYGKKKRRSSGFPFIGRVRSIRGGKLGRFPWPSMMVAWGPGASRERSGAARFELGRGQGLGVGAEQGKGGTSSGSVGHVAGAGVGAGLWRKKKEMRKTASVSGHGAQAHG